jgi:hypothetical protein
MRRLLWAVLLLVLAASGGAWWVYQSRDELLASAIRTYGPQITGVPVKLKGVHVQPDEGLATLSGLELGNPPGFKTPHSLKLDQVQLRLDLASLRSDVVQIQEIRVSQPRVAYEYAATGSNLDVIQRHLEAYVAQHAGAPATSTKPTRLIIERFSLVGASADVSAEALHGRAVRVALPSIHLRDIGKRAGGVTPAEAASQIVGALREETTRAVMPLHLGGVVDTVRKGAASVVDRVKGFFK